MRKLETLRSSPAYFEGELVMFMHRTAGTQQRMEWERRSGRGKGKARSDGGMKVQSRLWPYQARSIQVNPVPQRVRDEKALMSLWWFQSIGGTGRGRSGRRRWN